MTYDLGGRWRIEVYSSTATLINECPDDYYGWYETIDLPGFDGSEESLAFILKLFGVDK